MIKKLTTTVPPKRGPLSQGLNNQYKKVRDQKKVVKGNFNPNEEWWKARSKKASGGVVDLLRL